MQGSWVRWRNWIPRVATQSSRVAAKDPSWRSQINIFFLKTGKCWSFWWTWEEKKYWIISQASLRVGVGLPQNVTRAETGSKVAQVYLDKPNSSPAFSINLPVSPSHTEAASTQASGSSSAEPQWLLIVSHERFSLPQLHPLPPAWEGLLNPHHHQDQRVKTICGGFRTAVDFCKAPFRVTAWP